MQRAQIEQLRAALAGRNVTMEYLDTGQQALARLKELVPLGVEVMTGSSTTLDQIGFTAWLRELHAQGRVRYFRAEVHQDAEPAVRTANRRQATLAPYYLGSVNALTMAGEAVVADQSGSRIGGYVFGAQNVIWVVGTNKIVPTLDDAIRRVWEVALPGEDARIRAEGGRGSTVGKLVIFYNEPARHRTRLLVGEELGFSAENRLPPCVPSRSGRPAPRDRGGLGGGCTFKVVPRRSMRSNRRGFQQATVAGRSGNLTLETWHSTG